MSTAPSEVLMPSVKKKVKKPTKDVVVEADALVTLAHECENMSREAAFAALPTLLESVDSNYIKLGGVLAVIRDHGWWSDLGYETLSACLEKHFGLQYRKAAYLMQAYENLVNSGVEWAQVKALGWSKLRVVSSVLTKDNVAEWVEKAASLTVLQLYDVVREYKAQSLETSGLKPDQVQATTTTLSFKLHVDQKETIKQALEKARKEAATEFDAVALEAICINYLAGGKVTKKKTVKLELEDVLKHYAPEQALEAFGKVWPDIDIEVTMP